MRQGDWILLDYLDVVVHVFTPDARGLLPARVAVGPGAQRVVRRRMPVAAERLFTLEEAQALLDGSSVPWPSGWWRLRSRLAPLEGRWRRLVIAIGSNGGNFEKPEVRKMRDRPGAAAEG